MRRSLLIWAAPIGLLLMVVGSLGPWATAHPVGTSDVVAVSGIGNGARPVLVLAALGVVAILLRRRIALLLVTAVALGWLLLTGSDLPGLLNDKWAWGETDLAWGIFVAGLGAVLAFGAALPSRGRA